MDITSIDFTKLVQLAQRAENSLRLDDTISTRKAVRELLMSLQSYEAQQDAMLDAMADQYYDDLRQAQGEYEEASHGK